MKLPAVCFPRPALHFPVQALVALSMLLALPVSGAPPASAQAPPTTAPGTASGAPSDAKTGASVAELVESGRRALGADQADQAADLFRRALQALGPSADGTPPADGAARVLEADIRALLGRALSLTDHYAEAADQLDRAVALGHDDVATLLYLGSAQWESQRLEPAVASLRRAAQKATGTSADFLAHHQLGRLLLWVGRPAEAVEPLERAASLRPEAFDAHLDLARSLERSGALERAVEVYRQALAMMPDSHYAHWGLAQTLLRLGRRDEAQKELAAYRRLYEADKERTKEAILSDARLARARELFEQRKLDEAERIVLELPENPQTLEALARIRATAGNFSGAVEALERAVAIAPDRDDLRRLLAEARLLAQEAADGS